MNVKPRQNASGRRKARLAVAAWLWTISISALCEVAHGDTFTAVAYDALTDELVITMAYRGTNPDHTFSLKWGPCQTPANAGEPEIVVEVLDSQWQDAARQPFRKTTRFSLADLPCRPAKLTLRTAPRFFTTLLIPARSR